MRPATQSERRRDYVIVGVLGLIPDALIAFVAMKLTDDEWSTFWGVVIAFQAIYFLLWLKRTVWRSLVWRLYARRRAAAEALAMLKSSGLPKPEDDDRSMDGFLTRLIDDDEQPIAVRMRAAKWSAEIDALSSQGLQTGLQTGQMWQDAFTAYAKG
jgi:hypothetical protein